MAYPQEALIKKTIKIKGIESRFVESLNTRVYEVETQDAEKFSFWETKKDGSLTKASEQYQKFRFIAGDSVEIAFKESDGSFNNSKTGQRITKVNRTIVYFAVSDENTPKQPTNTPTAQKPATGNHTAPQEAPVTREEFNKALGRIKSLELMLNAQKTFTDPVDDEPLTVGGEVVPF